MERRDFLRFTAVTSSLAALYPPSAEALPALSGAGGSDEEMDRFLRHLDGVMARSRERAFLEPFRPLAEGPKEPVAQAAARRQEELFGKILRSLMMVGSFSDLPEQGQRHPGMQRRLRERAQEVDEALYGTLDLLGNLSPAERLDLTQAFREEPDLALRLGETLDAQAAHAGISMKRRLHLRRMITHLTWRIKHQGASAVVEDYVAQAQAFQTQLTSLIVEGVFARHPNLKVVMLESGFTWLPSFLWRLHKFWRGARMETPWVDRAPLEIVRSNIRFSLQPVDAPPDPETLKRLFDHMQSDELILFSTDYPHWQFDGDEALPKGLSADLVRKIMIDNPMATYGRLGQSAIKETTR